MKWYEYIKQRRKAKGLTQADAARAIGVTYTAIGYWEKDMVYEPGFFTFMKYLEFLKIRPGRMLRIYEGTEFIEKEV